jgi:hypothetical protein
VFAGNNSTESASGILDCSKNRIWRVERLMGGEQVIGAIAAEQRRSQQRLARGRRRLWRDAVLPQLKTVGIGCHLGSVNMNQKEKAKRFAQLHVKGTPLLLYNAWDAGSARSVLEAGAKAIATSSWSVGDRSMPHLRSLIRARRIG